MDGSKKYISLRNVEEYDCLTLWKWRIEPSVRASAFSTKGIKYENHVEWFQNNINNDNCKIWIILLNKITSIGQVRVDFDNAKSTGIVDITIDSNSRKKGYGTLALKKFVKIVFCDIKITKLNAFIKEENSASIRAFEKTGFIKVGTEDKAGNLIVKMELSK